MGFPVPQGTFQCLCQDVSCSILVSIQYQPTRWTDMRSYGEGLLDPCPTRRAVLGSPVRLYSNDRDSMQSPVVLHPPEKVPPTGVGYGFGKMPVSDHIAYLEVLIGNQIARCDERVRRLTSEIFTLPLDFQISDGYAFPG